MQGVSYSRPRPSLSFTLLKLQIIASDSFLMLRLKFHTSTLDWFPSLLLSYLFSSFLTSTLFHATSSIFISFYFFASFVLSYLILSYLILSYLIVSFQFFSLIILFFHFFSSTVFQTLAGNRKSVYKHMLTKKHVGQCADVKSGRLDIMIELEQNWIELNWIELNWIEMMKTGLI